MREKARLHYLYRTTTVGFVLACEGYAKCFHGVLSVATACLPFFGSIWRGVVVVLHSKGRSWATVFTVPCWCPGVLIRKPPISYFPGVLMHFSKYVGSLQRHV